MSGTQHLSTSDGHNALAAILNKTGSPETAHAYLNQGIAPGTPPPKTPQVLANLSMIYTTQGRIVEADKLTREILGARKKHLGTAYDATLATIKTFQDSDDAEYTS
jgi:Flp pilus assembly protein TadD